MSASSEAGIGAREKSAKEPAYFTRAFCRACNGGWMSRLDGDVRVAPEALLLGQPRVGSPQEQQLWRLSA